MPPLIVGSTLSDLGQNSLTASQMENEQRNAIANRLMAQMVANQQNQRIKDDQGIRQDAINKEDAYHRNALAQQDRQWNTPNATTRYQMDTFTPYQKGVLELQGKQIDAMQNNPFGMNGSKLMDDAARHYAAQNKAQMDANNAANAANNLFAQSLRDTAAPIIASRLDKGADNKGFHWGLGGMTSDNAALAAQGIVGASVMPDGFDTDNAVIGTQNWWQDPNNPTRKQINNIAASKVIESRPELAPYVQWDATQNKFVAKDQSMPFMGGMFQQPNTKPATAPTVNPATPQPPMRPVDRYAYDPVTNTIKAVQ